jgi:hypothetical protein
MPSIPLTWTAETSASDAGRRLERRLALGAAGLFDQPSFMIFVSGSLLMKPRRRRTQPRGGGVGRERA